MSGFSASWLALREPADVAARSVGVVVAVERWLEHRPVGAAIDLGGGTGANLRYLVPRLPAVRTWRLVDHDDALLDEARRSIAVWALADRRDVTLLHGSIADPTPWIGDDVSLVTASALLDLVSDGWLSALVHRATSVGAAALFALSYDGRMSFDPTDADDGLVRDLVNRHQRSDKGLGGVALGPEAAQECLRLFEATGYEVMIEASDWIVGAEMTELQLELIAGWATAAIEMAPSRAAQLRAWQARRVDAVHARSSAIAVGHQDVAAWPRPRQIAPLESSRPARASE